MEQDEVTEFPTATILSSNLLNPTELIILVIPVFQMPLLTAPLQVGLLRYGEVALEFMVNGVEE